MNVNSTATPGIPSVEPGRPSNPSASTMKSNILRRKITNTIGMAATASRMPTAPQARLASNLTSTHIRRALIGAGTLAEGTVGGARR